MLMMPVLERALALDIIKSPLRNNVLVVRNPMELEGAQTQFKGEFRMLLKDEGFIQYSHWFRWRGESLSAPGCKCQSYSFRAQTDNTEVFSK